MLDRHKSVLHQSFEARAKAWIDTLVSDTTAPTTPTRMVHIRIQGRSVDVPLVELGLTTASSAHQILQVLASYLGLTQRQMDAMMLDQSPNGNWILRPAAVFG
jgi:hypothetical protein